MADTYSDDIKRYVKIIKEALLDKKAFDLKIIDISKISVMADYFIIASGNNQNQIKAMCDEVDEKMSKEGVHPRQTEGYESANWVLMDYSDIIVHVFDKENRLFYDLERIWSDGENVLDI